MKIEFPTPAQIPGLRKLWKAAFGDTEEFLDTFFSAAFSEHRCRCMVVDGTIAAALYWFDVQSGDEKLAYLYAVATHPHYRGRGLCRELMENTHALLKDRGYQGAILVPQEEGLYRMYGNMGYRICGGMDSVTCDAGTAVSFRAIGPEEFAALRRTFLPRNGVIQEGENLKFLSLQAEFFTGEGFLLTARREGNRLVGLELLGDRNAAPGLVAALGLAEGCFRVPGGNPWAMFLPLGENAVPPGYFGFAFD